VVVLRIRKVLNRNARPVARVTTFFGSQTCPSMAPYSISSSKAPIFTPVATLAF